MVLGGIPPELEGQRTVGLLFGNDVNSREVVVKDAVDAFFAPDGTLDVDMARRKKKLWTEVDPTMELVGW
jgi:hypothetical protein